MGKGFDERCYALLQEIPSGRVTTYKEIAHALGAKAYRAVGNAMNKNPYPKESHPCHRVVRRDGSVGGYAEGTSEKIKLLTSEGLVIKEERVVDFRKIVMRADEFGKASNAR